MYDDENKEKQCVVCGKLFVPKIKTQICCSKECYKEHLKEYCKQWYQKNRECCKESRKQYYQSNKENIKERGKQYRQENKQRIKKYKKQYYQNNKEYYKELSKQYRQKNKKYLKEYEKQRYQKKNEYRNQRRQTDPNYKMLCWCRTQLHRCLNSKKTKNTFDILDYTPDELRLHLESQFKEDMSWDNHGTLWHIDHIKPLCSFNFINEDGTPNYDVIREANSLDNLQPLYIEENLSKGGRIN